MTSKTIGNNPVRQYSSERELRTVNIVVDQREWLCQTCGCFMANLNGNPICGNCLKKDHEENEKNGAFK